MQQSRSHHRGESAAPLLARVSVKRSCFLDCLIWLSHGCSRPKVRVSSSPGAPTMAHLNTADGAPSLNVAAVHYLNFVSGGTLSAAPGAPNRFVVPESMAALDLKCESHSSLGAPTMANVNTAAGKHHSLWLLCTTSTTSREERCRRLQAHLIDSSFPNRWLLST